MKTFRLLSAVLLSLGALGYAQDSAAPPVEITAGTPRSAEELDQLLGPIALYPDALIALILPAATVPADVVLAARYLQETNPVSQVENRAWDDSVKALTHYPEVVKWMDQNLTWTQQVGEAYRLQPDDVMSAVQRLRARAQTVGSLVDTPQQQVVAQSGVISIVPVQPDVIYVPYYDPQVVYVSRPYYLAASFNFSAPYATGLWLSYGVDWDRRRVCYVPRADRPRYWNDYRRHWHRAMPAPAVTFSGSQNYFRPWTPPPTFGYASRRPGTSYSRPTTVAPRTTYSRPPETRGTPAPYDPLPYRYAPETRSSSPGNRGTTAGVPSAPPSSRTYSAPVKETLTPPAAPRVWMTTPVQAPGTVMPAPNDIAHRVHRGDGKYPMDNRHHGYRGSRPNASASDSPTVAPPALNAPPAGPAAAPASPSGSPRQGARSSSGWTRPATPPATATTAPVASPEASSSTPAAPEAPRPNSGTWGRGRPGR